MIKWLKRKQDVEDNLVNDTSESVTAHAPVPKGFYSGIKESLAKTRLQLGNGIGRLLLGKKTIDAGVLEDLETVLIQSDIGVETSRLLLDELSQEVARNQLTDGDALFRALQNKLSAILDKNSAPLLLDSTTKKPFVLLMVGVNGAGKTTTIGKLAKQFQQQGKKVMLGAGDTFRAAAVEQLKVWGERNQIPVISQHSGADSASVSYDALQAAIARNVDVLIVDTAGRLHTQTNLMEELKKIKRVLQKVDPEMPQEIMLVLDASIGQNALNQAREFHQAVGLTGITMTKLDGTAKGGIVFAIANELSIPFRYLGLGEKIDDLKDFEADSFVKAIFND